jgi:hypothetical protein
VVQAEIDHNPHYPSAEARFSEELRQSLPAFDPSRLAKINGLIFVAHHAEGAGVHPVPMPRHQFLEGAHITLPRRPHQRRVLILRMISSSHS